MPGRPIGVDVLAEQAFVIARALFALDPDQGERDFSYRETGGVGDGPGPAEGKYIFRRGPQGEGYIYVRPGGMGGAYLTELPPGVPPEDVIRDESDAPNGTPLQDRLRAILDTLSGSADPQAADLSIAVSRILDACRSEHEEEWFNKIKAHGWTAVLSMPAESPEAVVGRAEEFLTGVSKLAWDMRAQPVAGAKMTAGLMIFEKLPLARAAAAQTTDERARVLHCSVGYIAAPSDVPLPVVSAGLCQRTIREGGEDIVRAIADEFKEYGDCRIEDGLDGGIAGFYPPLFEAIGHEVAARIMCSAAAELTSDPDELRRWRKPGVNAEERCIRIANSLTVAVLNLDGTHLGEDRALIREIRRQDGDIAALVRARELVENLLYYPREALPILLGTEDDDLRRRAQRPQPR